MSDIKSAQDLGRSLGSNDESSKTCQIALEYGSCRGSGTRLRVLDADWQKKREGEIKVRQCKGMCSVKGLVASQRLALSIVCCLLIVDTRPLMFFWLSGTCFFWMPLRGGHLAQRRRPHNEPEAFSILNRCSAWHSVSWPKLQGRQVCRLVAFQDLAFVASLLRPEINRIYCLRAWRTVWVLVGYARRSISLAPTSGYLPPLPTSLHSFLTL